MPSSVGTSAQDFLAIDTIRENTVVMKDGSLRVVLMCSSLNFALKSTDEQDALIFQYQNFINSLDFSLQIVIHSRKFNIGPYLETLQQREKEEVSELMKIQISEYREFIKTFVETTNIMSKNFYVIIPFTPTALGSKKGLWGGLFGQKGGSADNGSFEEYKTQAWQRAETATEGLRGFGIRSVPLNTEELIELFYGLYNPTEFEGTAAAPTENKK